MFYGKYKIIQSYFLLFKNGEAVLAQKFINSKAFNGTSLVDVLLTNAAPVPQRAVHCVGSFTRHTETVGYCASRDPRTCNLCTSILSSFIFFLSLSFGCLLLSFLVLYFLSFPFSLFLLFLCHLSFFLCHSLFFFSFFYSVNFTFFLFLLQNSSLVFLFLQQPDHVFSCYVLNTRS